jgi:hypothetical protein
MNNSKLWYKIVVQIGRIRRLGRRSLVEGVDVAAPTCLFLAVLQGKP